MTSFAFKGVLFCLGLGAVLTALGPVRQSDPSTRVGRKLAGLEAGHDRITDVFVGSSLASYHIVPTLYDSLHAAEGLATYTHNLGIAGAHRLEVSYLVDDVLRRDLPRLERIVVELGRLTLLPTDRPLTDQDAYYHDARRVWLGTQVSRSSELSKEEEREQIALRWKMGLRRASLAGQGRGLVRALADPAWQPLAQGYISLETAAEMAPGLRASRAAFLSPEGQQAFRDQLATFSTFGPPRAGPTDSLAVEHFNELVGQARARGVQIIFLVEPLNSSAYDLLALREKIEAPVISFYSVEGIERLLDEGAMFDAGHLRAWAARDFTRALADSLRPYVGPHDGAADRTLRPDERAWPSPS